MSQNFLKAQSLVRILYQNLCDKILDFITRLYVVRELETASFDAFVSLLDVLSLERRFADDQGINYNSKRPDINSIAVALFIFKNFWCYVVWCAAQSISFLVFEFKLSSQTKVSQLDLPFFRDEEISQL